MADRRAAVAVVALLSTFCTLPIRQRSFTTAPGQINRTAKYLKAHMRSGDVYLLTQWQVDDAEKVVTGSGDHFNADRKLLEHGNVSVPVDSVALFETNVIGRSKRIQSLSILTGVTVAITVGCLASPKSCYGSCPTFYASDGDQWSLQAEGFSASIAPALEDTDLDALYRVRAKSSRFKLRMTNEALETHVVKAVRVLAAPREHGARVFATADRQFWSSSNIVTPLQCSAPEGDCRAAVSAFDGQERFSTADRHDLSRHESVDLVFSSAGGAAPRGIVIAARQTFVSTFLLYQALSYLGSRTTAVLASLESGGNSVERRAGGMARLLGGIDVLVENKGRWRKVATYNETGPLATDVRLLPLPDGLPQSGRIRLSMARGMWRLDYVALASLDHRVQPVALDPIEIRQESVGAVATHQTITTRPGDAYEFSFDLPGNPEETEIFLESRGYYLEWMRDEWVAEESPLRAAMMFYTPHLAMRVLAPRFKEIEPNIEAQFWSSRYEAHH